MMRTTSISRLMGCASAAALIASCGRSDLYIGFVQIDAGAGAASSSTTTTASGGTGGVGGAPLCVPGAMQSCYSGPAGTEGQGICRAGSQVCAADGASWGACEGEVLPATEDCATPIDEDCDGMSPPCKGNLLWAKRFGGSSSESANSVAVDMAGNIIVAGHFSGTVDFGGGALTSAGSTDIFVVKLDPNGDHVWSYRFGDAGSQSASAIAVDATGNVVLSGYFGGAVDFGGGALASAGGIDVFVAKLNSDGMHLWSKSFGDADDQRARGVAVDPVGNVLLVGSLNGSVSFGGTPLVSAGGSAAGDVFVAKLDTDGAHLWSQRFGDSGDQEAKDVSTDPAGNVAVTGLMQGDVDFGGGLLSSAGGSDMFVIKLDAMGAHLWGARFGDAGEQVGWSVAMAASGDVVVAGDLQGSVDLGSGPLVSAGGTDVILGKLTTTGGPGWSKRFGDGAEQGSRGLAIDAMGNVVVAGAIDGAADFGGGPEQSAGSGDVFLAKFDGAGSYLWSKRFGDGAGQFATSVAVDGLRNVVLIGYFASTIDFGSGPMTSAGGSDIFIAKFSE